VKFTWTTLGNPTPPGVPKRLRRGTRALALIALGSLSCSRSRPSPAVDAWTAPDAVASAAIVLPGAPPALSIFYSADLRGRTAPLDDARGNLGGLARRATAIDQARASGQAVIVVDAGDFLPISSDDGAPDASDSIEQRTRIVLASYKRIGVGAVTPGERELALGPARLGALLRSANTRAVAANVVTAQGKPIFDGDAIVEADGISVGVFGIAELPPEAAASLERVGLTTTDGVEATRASVESLRRHGVGLVVGLFHLAGGAARAEQILGRTGDVDIVVLGHGSDDAAPRAPFVVGRTLIVHAGAHGSHLGRVDVRSLDAGAPRFEDHSIALTRAIPDHLGVGLLPQIEPERARIAEEKAAAAERRKKGQKEPEVFESWTYGSNAACAFCHQAAMAQWKTTDHSDAMATLKKKGHDSDPACLGCHTTGYLQPGGTRSIETAHQQFGDVGCECCHGPSALHVRSVDKKKGTSRKVEATVCFGCHTSDQNLGAFDYAAAVRSIVGPGHGAAPR